MYLSPQIRGQDQIRTDHSHCSWPVNTRGVKKKVLGEDYGHPGAGLGSSESKAPTGTLVLDAPRSKLKKHEIHEVRLRPRMEAIMGDAYHIAHAAIRQLQEKLERGELFTESDSKMFRALVGSLVDLSREERMQLETFRPEEYDTDTIIEVLAMAKDHLPGKK